MSNFDDDFTEGSDTNLESHTPNTGTAWTLDTGGTAGCFVIGASVNTLKAVISKSGYVYSDDLSSTDHETIIQRSGFLYVREAFAVVGGQDVSNFAGGYRLYGTGSAGRRLTKCVSGTLTDLGTNSQGVSGEWIKVERVGTTITMYEGGTGASPGTWNSITSATVSDFSSETKQGVVNQSAAATTIWLDHYTANSLGGGGGTTVIKLAGEGGLAGLGGLAGRHGGLAG